MSAPDPWSDVEALHHPGRTMDLGTGVAEFHYELRRAATSTRFTETIVFPVPERLPDAAVLAAFHRVLDLLYVAAGTSYYKLAAPPEVTIDAIALPPAALAWATQLYRQGLAEYAYRNSLPHVLDVTVNAEPGPVAPVVVDRLMPDRPPLVAVGGGKDSIVSIEALQRAGMRPVLFAVKPNALIRAVMDASGCPTLAVGRRLDPLLFTLTAEGGYNGHIPVTAINSLVGVAAALLHGYGPVVMSNERSASSGNLIWRGHDVNHQWSKSLEAEGLLRDALATHAGLGNVYFSLLRGLSELHIARLFAPIPGYDDVVSSCNAAFRIGDENPRRWCANCDKCRFVFLALAPFVERDRLVKIFDADMLEDMTQLPGYRQLCGLSTHKPFECVGETDECLVALRMLSEHPRWSSAAIVRQLATEARWPTDDVTAHVFDGAAPNFLPAAYTHVLDSSA